MGGQGGCDRRIEVFVKVQKKKMIGGMGGGGVFVKIPIFFIFFWGGGGGMDVNEELKFLEKL